MTIYQRNYLNATVYWFRTETGDLQGKESDPEPSKTIVVIYDCGNIQVKQRILTDQEYENTRTLRKWKDRFYVEREIAFKPDSFDVINEIVRGL